MLYCPKKWLNDNLAIKVDLDFAFPRIFIAHDAFATVIRSFVQGLFTGVFDKDTIDYEEI